MAARALGLPHLQVFHALTLAHHWGKRPHLARGYLRWLGLWNDRFVGVSETVGHMLRRNGAAAERVAIVPNGVNPEAIRAAALRPLTRELAAQIEGRGPVLVTLGRISAMKGHDLLVETLARIKSRYPRVVWVVGGTVLSSQGVEDTISFYDKLQARIVQLQLESNVVFAGQIENAPAVLARADVYVQPSRTESFCRAAVEALICGAPVVAFEAGALPEVLGPGGILAPRENVECLAQGILRLLSDGASRQRLVALGQRHVERYRADYSAAALKQVVARVCAHRARAV
jgi:glycosyltransferase involved in cell wall biosynthesis